MQFGLMNYAKSVHMINQPFESVILSDSMDGISTINFDRLINFELVWTSNYPSNTHHLFYQSIILLKVAPLGKYIYAPRPSLRGI